MEYVTAGPEHIDGIHHVMQSTIRAVYPKYYPTEVVDFFCQLHSREHVQEGVESGNRDVLLDEGKIVGVGCADGNHITSVCVLPECQGQGFGSHILDCLEARIAREHETAVLDASLPAVMLYEHRGYKTTRRARRRQRREARIRGHEETAARVIKLPQPSGLQTGKLEL